MTEAKANRPIVDWEAVAREYRAGVLTLRQIADAHGVTHGAINKRAKRDGWSRDLAGKIKAKADDLVSKSLVSSSVSKEERISEREIVEANAEAIVSIRIGQRKDIQRNRSLALKLLDELEAHTDGGETLRQLAEMAVDPESSGADKLLDTFRKVISLPSRIDSAKKLAETLRITVALEREAFGLDDDRPAETGLGKESVAALRKLKAALENAD